MANEKVVDSYYQWGSNDFSRRCVDYKRTVLNCYYDWNLSWPMLDQFKLFSDHIEIQSNWFGRNYKELFYLKLKASDGSARICLKLSSQNFTLEKLKITMNDHKDLVDTSNDLFPYKVTFMSNELGYDIPNWKCFNPEKNDIKFHCEIKYYFDSKYKDFMVYQHHVYSNEFEKALKFNQFFDVTICTSDGIKFHANKLILSIRSPVFETMFRHQEFKENQENVVYIEDIDSELMKHLLFYIYCKEISFDDKLASKLISPAHKYSIQSLVNICAQIMVNNIELESAAKLLYFGHSYQIYNMKEEAMYFIKYNSGVKETGGWKEFIKPNADLLEELVFFMSSH